MQRKYNFNSILKEYNKKHGCAYTVLPEISNAVIVHIIEASIFYVTYLSKDNIFIEKRSLADFIYYYASSSMSEEKVKDIILFEEDKKLNLKIKIWPPDKIRYAYLDTNYFAKGVGILGKSCMRSKEMQKSLNFYVRNGVKIVVVIDNKNKIHARALLWDNIKSTCNKKTVTYLDRIYARSDSLLPLFHKLVKENNLKQYKGTSSGNAQKNFYKDNLDISGMCHLPYTDTFKYLWYKSNLISSSENMRKVAKYPDSNIALTSTENGGYYASFDPNRTQEVLTRNYISIKDAIFVKKYDGYVLKENIVNIDGNYYSKYDIKIIKTKLDDYILEKDSVIEVITNNLINKFTAIHSVEYNGYVHKSNVVFIKGKIYHKNDVDIICFDDKWYHVSQCFRNFNRKNRNKEFAKQQYLPWIHQDKFPLNDCFVPYPDAVITVEGDLIPKKYTTIAYNLIYNPILNNIEYQKTYRTNENCCVRLITGELIINSNKNKKYIKKFNNKYYIRHIIHLSDEQTIILPDTEQTFKLPNKNQLLLFT